MKIAVLSILLSLSISAEDKTAPMPIEIPQGQMLGTPEWKMKNEGIQGMQEKCLDCQFKMHPYVKYTQDLYTLKTEELKLIEWYQSDKGSDSAEIFAKKIAELGQQKRALHSDLKKSAMTKSSTKKCNGLIMEDFPNLLICEDGSEWHKVLNPVAGGINQGQGNFQRGGVFPFGEADNSYEMYNGNRGFSVPFESNQGAWSDSFEQGHDSGVMGAPFNGGSIKRSF